MNMKLESNIRYSMRVAERSSRLFRHIHTLSAWLSVIGASSAAAVALGEIARGAVPWLALAGAVIAAYAAVTEPLAKAIQHEEDAAAFESVLIDLRTGKISEEDAERKLFDNKGNRETIPEAIRWLAWRDVALENGRDDALVPLSVFQRCLSVLA